MVREYRGKHIHAVSGNKHLNGTWVYGYLCAENYINSPKLKSERLVDETTIGQFTGKLDKNEKKIYEGDIVRFSEWSLGAPCWVGVVQFDYCLYCVRGGKNEECDTNFEVQLSRIPSERIEVIGNIYDNPELLVNCQVIAGVGVLNYE